MIATLRSEWIKVRTVRSNVTMALVAVVLPMVITLLSVAFMNPRDIDSGTLPGFVLATGSVAVLLIGVVGVLCITQEYSQGTIRLTLAATPARARLWTVKAVLMATIGALLTGIIVVVSLVLGSAILESRDVAGPHTADNSAPALVAMVSMGALVAILGLGVGSLTRNPPSAITILVLWPLLIEGIVGSLLSLALDGSVTKWLPFQAGFNSMFPDEPADGLSRWPSLGYFAIWVLAVAVVAVRRLQRRDA